jgi:vancomycin resistance protein VanW
MKLKKLRYRIKLILDFILLRSGKFCKQSDLKINTKKYFVISSFSTKIKLREELGEMNHNRIHNIKLCCDLLNGIQIKTNEIFSMQKLIGEATVERGFKNGPTIINNKLSQSVGGGLCQVSTTLFNVALLGNCKILEKHNHSSDIWGEKRFIELGRDATYAFARLDLKFKNTSGAPLILHMEVDKEKLELICKLLSSREQQEIVKIESVVLKKLNPNNHIKGENNVSNVTSGWLVKTTRKSTTQNGQTRINYKRVEKYKPVFRQN